ncbi:MAG: bifunctional precorrin-2 dehydrogenase/sirohydrochlorin ferrochelatase, partial [Lachnospiraceae bacterium]|nr:bifunctional precorrin-2 dehydrogenase/sirohydrochlorin ferrochelatase [Lachnospiraceae bacterium]
NSGIYSVCKCLGIQVNVCSDKNKCDFYFPGVVHADNVVVGITASGTDHHQAKVVREEIERVLKE